MPTKGRRPEEIKKLLLNGSPYKEKIPERTVVAFIDSMTFERDVVSGMNYQLVSDLLSESEFETFLLAIGIPLEHFDGSKKVGYGKNYKRVNLKVADPNSKVVWACGSQAGWYCYNPTGPFE